MLELDSISTRYGVVNMLNQVSLQVPEHSIVCLLGPNGAGKTTTFKAIAGLLPVHHGAIRVMGQPLARMRTEDLAGLGVGFVPEGRRLFAELTVQENLKIGHDALRPQQGFAQALERVVALFPGSASACRRQREPCPAASRPWWRWAACSWASRAWW